MRRPATGCSRPRSRRAGRTVRRRRAVAGAALAHGADGGRESLEEVWSHLGVEWREHEVQSSRLTVGVPARLDECVANGGDIQFLAADLEDREVGSMRDAQAVNLLDAAQQKVAGVSNDASHLAAAVCAEDT